MFKLIRRIKFAVAMCLWVGGCMAIFSAIVAVILGRDFYGFYFSESRVFYKIAIVVGGVFLFSFFFGKAKSGNQ